VLAGLIEGDGNLYVSRRYNMSYVRLYTPDVTQILWTINAAMELFDKYPIIGIDKPKGNKRLYTFRLEYHDPNIYVLFDECCLECLSKEEIFAFITGLVYTDGHLKIRRRGNSVSLNYLEIEVSKKKTANKILNTLNALSIKFSVYRRRNRNTRAFIITDRDIISKIMDLAHINWKWVKYLALTNVIDTCNFIVARIFDHIILNLILGKLFTTYTISKEENSLLSEILGINSQEILNLKERKMTRAYILSKSMLKNIDSLLRYLMENKDCFNICKRYLHLLSKNEKALYSTLCPQLTRST